MRRIIIAWALLLIGFFCIGQSSAYWQSRDSNYNISVSSGGCSQATTFLARTSGLSGTQSGAYTTLICGLVTDGIITGTLSGGAGCGAVLDGLYVLASNTTTTANLNLCGTSFGLTAHNTPTFTANNGYTGNGSSTYLDPSYTPSTAGGNCTQNSCTVGACSLTNSAAPGANTALWGGEDGSGNQTALFNLTTTSFTGEINGDSYPANSVETNTQGAWVISRTVSTALTGYLNAVDQSFVGASTSTGLLAADLTIMAFNNNGSIENNTNNQVAYAFMGGGLNSTQVTAIYNRLHTYLSTVGAGSGC